jgi:hypothetical protein
MRRSLVTLVSFAALRFSQTAIRFEQTNLSIPIAALPQSCHETAILHS